MDTPEMDLGPGYIHFRYVHIYKWTYRKWVYQKNIVARGIGNPKCQFPVCPFSVIPPLLPDPKVTWGAAMFKVQNIVFYIRVNSAHI
jgi:hypothetical protein